MGGSGWEEMQLWPARSWHHSTNPGDEKTLMGSESLCSAQSSPGPTKHFASLLLGLGWVRGQALPPPGAALFPLGSSSPIPSSPHAWGLSAPGAAPAASRTALRPAGESRTALLTHAMSSAGLCFAAVHSSIPATQRRGAAGAGGGERLSFQRDAPSREGLMLSLAVRQPCEQGASGTGCSISG